MFWAFGKQFAFDNQTSGMETDTENLNSENAILQSQSQSYLQTHINSNFKQSEDEQEESRIVNKQKSKDKKKNLSLSWVQLLSAMILKLWPFYILLFVGLALKFYSPKIFQKKRTVSVKSKPLPSDYNHPDPDNQDFEFPKLNSSEFKGFKGKRIVSSLLFKYLDRNLYYIFDDVTLSYNNGTSQIDHIVVSPFGIFVLETKNMKGVIDGNQYKKTWIQFLFKSKKSFLNPIHQNETHIRALKRLLKLEYEFFYNLVVFVDNIKFKFQQPHGVYFLHEMIEFIRSQKNTIYSDEEVKKIINYINAARF